MIKNFEAINIQFQIRKMYYPLYTIFHNLQILYYIVGPVSKYINTGFLSYLIHRLKSQEFVQGTISPKFTQLNLRKILKIFMYFQ